MIYPVKAPWILRRLYPQALWRMPAAGRKVYLTFDDGPHPTVTPFVMEQLQRYGAKATFFCIGQNAVDYPQICQALLQQGHRLGNHTMNHCDGWYTTPQAYLQSIRDAASIIDSNLFRPPYGRITPRQVRALRKEVPPMQLVFWDSLSGDFDRTLSVARCVKNVTKNVRPGSIIVFHDSEKAYPRLKMALPEILGQLKNAQYECAIL